MKFISLVAPHSTSMTKIKANVLSIIFKSHNG